MKTSSLLRSLVFALFLSFFPTFVKSAFAGDKLPYEAGKTAVVTRGYGITTGNCGYHGCDGTNSDGSVSKRRAIDFAPPNGTTFKAAAARGGQVVRVNKSDCANNDDTKGDIYGYGCYVMIKNGTTVDTYAHLQKDSILVNAGDNVTQGQHLATIGTTGLSTGVHLHWERNDYKASTNQPDYNNGVNYIVTFDENSSNQPWTSQNSGQSNTQPQILTSFYVVNNQIRFKSSTDGINFGAETPIPNIQTNQQVAAIVFNGKYNVFYRNSSEYINAIYWNGSSWSSPTQLGNTTSTTPPVVAIQNGYMNVMYASPNGEIKAYYSNNPGVWGGPITIPNANTVKPFSLIVDNNYFNLYYAKNGGANSGQIMRQYNSGNGWSQAEEVRNGSTQNVTTEGVSAVLDGSYHNVFYRNSNGNINQVYTNNGTWSNPVTNAYVGTKATPKVVNYFGTLKLFILGNGTDNRLFFQSYSNGWQNNSSLFTIEASGFAPEAIVFQQ